MANLYELRCYGILYHVKAKDAESAKKQLATTLNKKYKSKTVKPSHITLVRYYRG